MRVGILLYLLYVSMLFYCIVLADPCINTPCQTEYCDYIVAGGGIGGVYTAYKLLQSGRTGTICLLEQNEEFGGRLKTVTLGNGKRVDIGGTRVNADHYQMLKLADELGIAMQGGTYDNKIAILSRDLLVRDHEALRPVYPTAGNVSGWDILLDTNTEYYKTSPLQDTFSFTQNGLGTSEDMQYFMAGFRFRGDFQGVDRKTYTEFALADSVNPLNFYPNNGMQEYTIRMIQKMSGHHNIKIRPNNKILNIERYEYEARRYVVQTKGWNYVGKNLVIALTPLALQYIGGNVVRELNAQKAMIQSKPIPVAVVVLRFQDRWWEQVTTARRLWTSDNCIQLMEQPLTPARQATNAFRAVYADGYCAQDWESLYRLGGKELVQVTLMTYMTEFYPNVTIPEPLEIIVKIWDQAWYFETPNATVSLETKEQWSIQPLGNEPLYLVGEAYNIYRTWAQGALSSADNVLARIGLTTKGGKK